MMPRSRPQDPETKLALLVNATGRATPHVFVGAAAGTTHNDKLCWLYMFECTVTKQRRVWGYVPLTDDEFDA
jgi:hypothetical protein